MRSMRARMHHIVLDCADADELAEFYSALLGYPVTYRSPDWVVVAENDHSSGIAFQPIEHYLPPMWPSGSPGQQLHLDLMVDDLTAADEWVVSLGARRLPNDGEFHEVYADPAGHPFCLITKPGWAPKVG